MLKLKTDIKKVAEVKKATDSKKIHIVNPPLLVNKPTKTTVEVKNPSNKAPQIVKTIKPIENEVKKIEEQQPLIKKLKIKMEKSNQFEEQFKKLNQELKNNMSKIQLDLSTNFVDDKELMTFSTNMFKLASQITYLKWRIDGNFTDDGQAKCIGDVVGRLVNAYRLELDINSDYFADTGATSLAKGFLKLKNLHVLKFFYVLYSGKMCKKMTELGEDKLKKAISNMPNLEMYNREVNSKYEEEQTDIMMEGFPKISHLLAPLSQYSDIKDVQKCFDKYSKQLTSIEVDPYYYEYEENQYEIKKNNLNFIKMIEMCFFEVAEYSKQRYENQQSHKELSQFLSFLSQYADKNRKSVLLIKAFNQSIRNELTINPHQVLIDLYY